METQDFLVISIQRKNPEAPWEVNMKTADDRPFVATLGLNSPTAIGVNMRKLLGELEEQTDYPVQLRFSGVADRNKRTVQGQLYDGKVMYIESNNGFLSGTRHVFEPYVAKETPEEEPKIKSNSAADSFTQASQRNDRVVPRDTQVTIRQEFVGEENQFWLFMDSRTVSPVNGGGLKGYIEGYYWPNDLLVPEKIGTENILEEQRTVNVDYLGIEAFSTSNKENTQKAKYYQLSPSRLSAVGREAAEYNELLIERAGILAISVQYDTRRSTPTPSKNGHVLGSVYITTYDTFSEAEQAIATGHFRGVNINKSLLKEQYSYAEQIKSDYPHSVRLPLVEFTGYDDASANDGIKTASWASEYNLNRPPNRESYERMASEVPNQYVERERKYEEIVETEAQRLKKGGEIRKDVRLKGYINNDTSYVPPKDDRLEDGLLYNTVPLVSDEDDAGALPYDYTHKVRIGDVMLEVPPLSIKTDKKSQNVKVQAMRSKTSMQKQVGHVRNVLTLELYFHDLDSINGKEVLAYVKHGRHVYYYMDGLRSLIAQFKKAPFLPIDNEYINEDLSVYNVALKSISAQTVEGFPEAIHATLILEEVDTATYLMGQQSLGEVINYPLFRWFYQDLLQEPFVHTPWKTTLPKINHLDNKVRFSIINEEALKTRTEAIKDFRQMRTPNRYKDSLYNPEQNENALMNSDGTAAKEALEAYEKFMAAYKEGAQERYVNVPKGLNADYPQPWYVPLIVHQGFGMFDKLTNATRWRLPQDWEVDGAPLTTITYKETDLGREIAKHLYGVHPTNNDISNRQSFYRGSLDNNAVSDPGNAFYTLRSTSSGAGVLGNLIPSSVYDEVVENNLPGFFQVILKDEANQRLLEDQLVRWRNLRPAMFSVHSNALFVNKPSGGGKAYIIPAGDTPSGEFLTTLKQIASVGEDIEEELDDYTFRYNALVKEINSSEGNMQMDEWDIPDLTPVSLNVQLENNLSVVQVQASEVPAMQYFGAQEPQVVMAFETTAAGVQAIDDMLRRVAHYTKTYRDGVVSGFIDIHNPLVNLFGIKGVLPDTVQFSTVPGFPDRRLVNLGMVGFDKSQRRQEALYGFTGGADNKELRDMAYDKYDPKVDALYIHERIKQMELYPDLELPKVSELIADLPYLESGVEKWENRTEQVYLDPDFYVSTTNTYRKLLKDILDDSEGVKFRLSDPSGIVANSNLKEGRPLIMSDSDIAEFEKQAVASEYVDPTLKWEDYEEGNIENDKEKETKEDLPETDSVIVAPPKQLKKSLNTWGSSRAHTTRPSREKMAEWAKDYTVIDGFNEAAFVESRSNPGKDITPGDMWFTLYYSTREAFSEFQLAHIDEDYMARMGNSRRQGEKKTLKRIWMTPFEFFWDDYTRFKNKGTKELKNGLEKEWEDQRGKGKGYFSEFIELNKNQNMPMMRLFTYMKAVMSIESNWQAYDGNKPLIIEKTAEGQPYKVGIMGFNLNKATSEEDAYRIMWDWRYNIKRSLEEMAKVYKKAKQSSYHEIANRRLDWAVTSHSGELPAIITSNKAVDDVPITSKKLPIAPESYAYFNALTQKWNKDRLASNGKYQYGIASDGNGRLIKDVVERLYKTTADKEKHDEKIDGIMTEMQHAQNNNVDKWTMEEKVKGMYVDMYQYDQTGRLLRAFPTFSLQLIDEGKWYRNFRTWDNFYGYHALNSIDVYKSRKIAADTAVIEMSNMYGNLTGMRNDMFHYDLMMPSFFSSHFFNHYVLGTPTEEVVEERREIYENIMLEAGARIHLRMGYGSDPAGLPVVFNGTITEVNADEIVQITAQGDGLELTNVITGSTDDKNKKLFKITEPSDMIGQLMTSKGNWLKDRINRASDNFFFKEHPLGIVHFGNVGESPIGNIQPWSSDYGESMENVYSQNGLETKEQWMKRDGTSVSAVEMYITQPIQKMMSGDGVTSNHDEDNILVSLYGSTPWEIIQTFALCTFDYVGAVFPFEFRSSLFFGKPHWAVTYQYDSQFVYDSADESITREITQKHQKTFMQAHVYTSQFNLIHNNISASEEGIFNNVIVTYDGRTAGPVQADNDIRIDRQRTAQVEANIIARSFNPGNYYTAEAQALKYGASTVRDFMKDMYKGTYTVLGDATVKPYDMCYLSDTIIDMQGVHLVKAVHHSMNSEEGFLTHIEPDAYVINFDAELLFLPQNVFAISQDVAVRAGGLAAAFGGSLILTPIISKMASGLSAYGIAKMNSLMGTRIYQGVAKHVVARSYLMTGKTIGSTALVEMSKQLAKTKSHVIATSMMTQLKTLAASELSAYSSKGLLTSQIKGLGLKSTGMSTVLNANFVGVNQSLAVGQVADTLRDIDRITNAFRAKKAKTVFVKGAGGLKAGAVKLKVTLGTLLTSTTFWLVAVTAVFHIASSFISEAWTRRKQNAEAVKVVPLQYKGRPFQAGMNGSRGAIVGSNPSLGDRLMHYDGTGDDEEVDKVWWRIIPKVLNKMSN